MVDQERFDRIRLARSEGVGPVSYRHLLKRFGSAGEALYALPELARQKGGRSVRPAPEQAIMREVERLAAIGGRWLIAGDSDYPALLAETADAPPVLTVRGETRLLHRRCVAIVGARNASAAARRMARELSRDLVLAGHVVVSGLARGIDTEAHQGALAGGTGGTIAVIASGIDIAYPPENAALQDRIAAEGLLIAEQPPGTEPRARNFPHRNRIIAGLSAATLVVEAAPRSGSLITARLAGEYGREVLAVPGSPLDPRSHGCNDLIRNGATLIQSAADVIEAIAPFAMAEPCLPLEEPLRPPAMRREDAGHPASPPAQVPKEPGDLMTLLGPVPVAVDELIRQSGLDPSTVQMALLDLELAGRLERHAGARVALRAEG
ncbi:MAG: DNA-processing protein DprA [Sphingobium sp.]